MFGHRYFGSRYFGARYFGPSAGLEAITGLAAITEAQDTLAATGQVALAAAAAITESADTLAATAEVAVAGAAAITEAAESAASGPCHQARGRAGADALLREFEAEMAKALARRWSGA
jgi:hypothetical protein